MKALVTGNLGFIGGAVTDLLLKKGFEVTGVDKNKKSKEPKSRIEITEFMNTADSVKMEQFKKDSFDYIFNFGSPCSNLQFMDNPNALDETIAGIVNVFEIAREIEAKVVYPSSCTVYAGEFPQSESTELPKPTTLYSVGKIAAENIAYYYEQTYNVKSTGARIFVAYGNREEYKGNLASAVTQFLLSIEKGEPPVVWGDGTQFRDSIHISDVAQLILRVAEDPESPRIINIGTGEAYTFNEIISFINEKLGKDIRPVYKGKPIWYRGNNKADISLARKLYKFNPRNLKDGLDEYIKYRIESGLAEG